MRGTDGSLPAAGEPGGHQFSQDFTVDEACDDHDAALGAKATFARLGPTGWVPLLSPTGCSMIVARLASGFDYV